MSDLKKAAEMALKVLEETELCLDQYEVIEVLRKALAQTEPEPVAHLVQYERHHEIVWDGSSFSRNPEIIGISPLYTAPPKREWVGLTGVDIHEVVSKKWWDWEDAFDIKGFSYAIEAKLKEKNT